MALKVARHNRNDPTMLGDDGTLHGSQVTRRCYDHRPALGRKIDRLFQFPLSAPVGPNKIRAKVYDMCAFGNAVDKRGREFFRQGARCQFVLAYGLRKDRAH